MERIYPVRRAQKRSEQRTLETIRSMRKRDSVSNLTYRRRQEHRTRGLQYYREKRGSAARDAFVRSIDVTPSMAYELIKILRAQGIPYVVAPYEADAQLAYLEQEGLIDAIITEDSDLLVFGCKTVLFKLDTYGHCVEIQRDRFVHAKQLAFDGWSHDDFRRMAILSGCDYLPSITGMGLKNAHKFLRKYESIERVLRVLQLEGKMHVPPAYAADFARAEFTFAHQRVWDPRGPGSLTTLAPLPCDINEDLLACIGIPPSLEEARAIAHGDLCPITRQPLSRPALGIALAPAQSVLSSHSVHAGHPGRAPQQTLHSFFRSSASAAPPRMSLAVSKDKMDRADSSTSSTTTTSSCASLFDTASRSTPCTSPAHSVSGSGTDGEADFDEKSKGTTPPPSSPDAHSESDVVDACVSSPASSPPPPFAPLAKVSVNPMHSTPARRASPPPVTPMSTGLAWHDTSESAEHDMARRSAWFQRFKYSGTRARHVVLPKSLPSMPRTPPTPVPKPDRRLRLGKRPSPPPSAAESPTTKRMALDTPRHPDVPAEASMAMRTLPSMSTTLATPETLASRATAPVSSVGTSVGHGSMKLLQFQYRQS